MNDSGPEMTGPEMGPQQAEMDRLLRRSLAAPIPSLSSDFDERVMREASRSSRPLDGYGRILLTGYGLASALVSAVLMRGQGLGWGATAGMILGPLLVVAFARAAQHGAMDNE